MAEPVATPTNIEALIEGGVSGQVAVGNYNVQIHADHGAVVHFLPPDRQPQPRPRPSPVLLRPRPFRGLLGRQPEVGAAASALRDGLPVELHGAPGIGKSALLRHFSYELETGSLPGGVVHLSARGQPAADLAQCLFDAFYECDLPFKPTDVQARHLLQGRQALVLVDDVGLTREEIERLLDTAPGCAFVLASQERHLWGEVRSVPLGGLPTEDALALLERELGRPLTPAERTAATDLCARLECHPLRLLQAAALAREGQRSLSELADEATRSASGREVVNRRTLEALAPVERQVVAILAAAEGAPVFLDALEELVGPEAERILQKLLERKVVQAHSPRYSLRVELDEGTRRAWQVEPWRDRLFSRLVLWAQENPSRVAKEAATLQQALRLAADAGQWEVVRGLGRALDIPLTVAGRWGAWAEVVERVQGAAEALGDEAGRGWVFHQHGTRALCLGHRERARQDLTTALEIRQRLGDVVGAAVTRHNLGILLGPTAPPESSAAPGPRRGFPRLLAWIGLPILLVLLILGGMRLWSERFPPDLGAGRVDPGDNGPVPPETPPVDRQEETPPETPSDPGEPTPAPPEPPAQMRLSPGTVDFGEQKTRSRSPLRRASIRNVGGSPLRLGTFRFTAGDTGSFAVAPGSCANATLAAGRDCEIELTFAPEQARPYSARLEVGDETGQISGAVNLQGVGTAPGLDVRPDRLSFGSVGVGSSVEPRTVAVVNTGSAPLQLAGVALAENPGGGFALRSECQGATLAPGKSCLAHVSFRARKPAEYRATLEIRSSGGEIEPRFVDVRGTVGGRPELTLSTASLDFGRREIRSTGPAQSVVVANPGSAPLRIDAIAPEGESAKDFSVRDGCRGNVVEPGGDCRIAVTFQPAAEGSRSAVLRVTDRTAGLERRVTLQGSGIAAARGWCCIAGKLSETSEAECKERQGGFFKKRFAASLACSATRAGCCVDGEFRAGVDAEECGRREGTVMTLLEAGFQCRKREEPKPETPPTPVQGWCCLNLQVFGATEERCRSAKGTFFTNKADADKACTPVIR